MEFSLLGSSLYNLKYLPLLALKKKREIKSYMQYSDTASPMMEILQIEKINIVL